MRLSRQDVRLAVRSFARHPGFTITAVLSLGLAIALNTTMYSVLDAMMNPKLDIREPDRLYSVILWGDVRRKLDAPKRTAILESGMSTYEALTYQAGSYATVTVEMASRYAQPSVAYVAWNFLDVFGVHPLRGRGFAQSDVESEVTPVMISERLASTLSPDDPFPVGTPIVVDGVKHPVIGVLTRGSVVPAALRPDVFILANAGTIPNIIRLRRGVTTQEANAEFSMLAARVAALSGESVRDVRYDLKRVTDTQFHPQNFHFALIAAVIAVLFVACANLANLQLARGIGRSREIALRTALGATRRDIVAQLLLESALLGLAGVVGGVLLTFWGTHLLDSRIPPAVAEYIVEPQISWRVFAFAMIAGLVSVLLVGLVPALRVSRVDPNELLKSGAGTGANKKNRQQYGVMVAAEIGFSLALLSGAALVVRTALHIRAANMGYDTRPLADAFVYLRSERDTTLGTLAYGNEVMARLKSIPDVAEASVATRDHVIKNMITVDERQGSPREVEAPVYWFSRVSPTYFRTMHLPILKGRDFIDGASATAEVIVDQHTARGLWPGVDPIGQQIKLGEYKSDAPWLRVVGVVAEVNDYRQLVLYDRATKSTRLGSMYVSLTTNDSLKVGSRFGASVSFVVRAKNDPERLPITLQRYLPRGGLIRHAATESRDAALGVLRQRQRHDFVASWFVTFAALGRVAATLS